METRDLIDEIKRSKRTLIYIGGKTATGKTTLAIKLSNELGFSCVSLDAIVKKEIVEKFQVVDVSEAYIAAYRDEETTEWRDTFIAHSRHVIESQIDTGIILEGAIASPSTLQAIISGYETAFLFYYLHPLDLDKYYDQIRQRFLNGAATGKSGLPKDFWRLLPDGALADFEATLKISPSIEAVIHRFAEKSQSESAKRLDMMKNTFADIRVIDLTN